MMFNGAHFSVFKAFFVNCTFFVTGLKIDPEWRGIYIKLDEFADLIQCIKTRIGT